MEGAENFWRFDLDTNLVKTIHPLAVRGYEEYSFIYLVFSADVELQRAEFFKN